MSVDKVWIQKFKQWKSIVQKGCPAGAGPGGVLCTWIGRNCNYNDCPRRNLEEIYVSRVDDKLELIVEELKTRIIELEEQLESQPVLQESAESSNPDLVKVQIKKIENG